MQQGKDTYRLVVRRGPQPNQIYELSDDIINLGRDITNDLVINDREVSRHHLRFTRGPEGYTIEDLGSTNGTFVNGKRVTGMILLKMGDMLGLGETVTLAYEVVRSDILGAASAGPAATPPPQAQAAPSPYQPPAENPYQRPQPAASPYQPPAAEPYAPQSPAYQPPAAAYTPAQPEPYQAAYQPPYQQGYPPQQAGYYQQYGPPADAGYDPYQVREEESGGGVGRIVLFGCLGLMVACCCATLIAFVIIDSQNLYCSIPVVDSLLNLVVGPGRCP